ncbi:MAG: DUF4443 domain-containing protein, partial [Candidatus Methanomethylicia archaeon]
IDLEHLVTALIIISKSRYIGRYRLAEIMMLPQGTVRGILERFSENGLIRVEERGCELTSIGEKSLREYFNEMGIECIKTYSGEVFKFLAPGEFKAILIMSGGGGKVTNGLRQRDEAIKAGAEGATTLVVRDNEIILPNMNEPIKLHCPNEEEFLRSIMRIEDDYVIILCWAVNEALAIRGALKAASTILHEKRNA